MKKTQKNLLGLSGLALVISVTVFAAFLPNPDASAVSSVTDTITVRVIGSSPAAEIVDPVSGTVTVKSDLPININYEHTSVLNVYIEYTDKTGAKRGRFLRSGAIAEETGALSYDFNTLSEEFGFGDYTISLTGEGMDGTPLPGDSVSFSYYPVLADVEKDPETGKTYLDLDYDAYGETVTGKVASLEINVYDQAGNLVKELSPIHVDAPNKKVELPFEKYNIESGKYRIEITAYGNSGDDLYRPYETATDYEAESWSGDETVPDANVPNTGSFFGSLNISKADYLITGALIFIIAGASAFVFIIKRSNSSKKRR